MHRVRTTRGSKHKPSKGMKQFARQNHKAAARRQAIKDAQGTKEDRKSIPEQLKAKWRKLQNWYWKTRFLKGKYTPHQGHQEKARRVRQSTEHKCIHPEAWS